MGGLGAARPPLPTTFLLCFSVGLDWAPLFRVREGQQQQLQEAAEQQQGERPVKRSSTVSKLEGLTATFELGFLKKENRKTQKVEWGSWGNLEREVLLKERKVCRGRTESTAGVGGGEASAAGKRLRKDEGREKKRSYVLPKTPVSKLGGLNSQILGGEGWGSLWIYAVLLMHVMARNMNLT